MTRMYTSHACYEVMPRQVLTLIQMVGDEMMHGLYKSQQNNRKRCDSKTAGIDLCVV